MSRVYTVTGGQSVAGAGGVETQVVVTSPSDAVTRIRRIRWGQDSHALSEQYLLEVLRASAAGSGGSAPVPEPKESGDAAFGGSIISGPTVEPTYGAEEPLFTSAWNSVIGGEIYFPEGERPTLSPTGAGQTILGIRVTNDDTTAMVPHVHVELEEIGG